MQNQPFGRWVPAGLCSDETVFTILKQDKLKWAEGSHTFRCTPKWTKFEIDPTHQFYERNWSSFSPYSTSCVSHAFPADTQGLSTLQNTILSSKQMGEGQGTNKRQLTWIKRKKKKSTNRITVQESKYKMHVYQVQKNSTRYNEDRWSLKRKMCVKESSDCGRTVTLKNAQKNKRQTEHLGNKTCTTTK